MRSARTPALPAAGRRRDRQPAAVLLPRAIHTLHPFAFQPLTEAAVAAEPPVDRRAAPRRAGDRRLPRVAVGASTANALADERRIVRAARATSGSRAPPACC